MLDLLKFSSTSDDLTNNSNSSPSKKRDQLASESQSLSVSEQIFHIA